MSPDLVLFAIRAAIRLGRAASLELEAVIRNADGPMPSVITVEAEPIAVLRRKAARAPMKPDERIKLAELFDAYDASTAAEPAIWAYLREIGVTIEIEEVQETRGLLMIRQWADGAKKEIPGARVGLAIIEVALDYARTDPGIFGIGSNGERFVRAIAEAIDKILPASDAENITEAKSLFGERSIAILMHAGLSALQEHVADNISEPHLKDITLGVLRPLTANFDGNVVRRKTLHDFQDLLLGPITQEALKSLARNREAFLGSRFGDDKALGAVTDEILKVLDLAEGDWSVSDSILARDVWVKVYGAILDVAIQRPELFGGQTAAAGSQFGRDLVKTAATSLKAMAPPFTASVAATITADAIAVLGRNSAILFRSTGAWDVVARNATQDVLTSVAEGLKAGLVPEEDGGGGVLIDTDKILGRVFSEEQAGRLIRIVVDQAAKTPEMITGRGKRDEVKALVASVARAVSASERNLLSADDWLEVVAILAQEAAKNPGRLFKIVDAAGAVVEIKDELATRLISKLLNAASADIKGARGRGKGSVLFGETLKHAMTTALQTAADDAAAAATNIGTAAVDDGALVTLVERINTFQGTNPDSFGADTWLAIYRHYLSTALLTGAGGGAAAVAAIKDSDLQQIIDDRRSPP